MHHTVSYEKRICVDAEKITELLARTKVGVLGLVDGTEPYAVPVNFVWKDGIVYFHGMGSGRKVRLLSKSPSVCFTVFRDDGTVTDPVPCHADTSYLSAMIFGKAERVTDFALAADALRTLLEKYAPGFYTAKLGGKLIEKHRSSMDGNGVAVYQITPEQMTAKGNDSAPDAHFRHPVS